MTPATRPVRSKNRSCRGEWSSCAVDSSTTLQNTASIKRALAACWGNAPIALLQGSIQVAVLNELFEGGGFSMVMKDGKGRFYREDGSPILDWQFRGND